MVRDQRAGRRGAKTRRLVSPSDRYKLYVPVLPDEVGPPKLPADAPEKMVEWDARLSKLRRDHATALFEMARRAVRTGQAGLAFDLGLGALQADPDYEPVRRLFGYQKFRNQWRTPYEVKKLRAGNVWSEKFGWLPKAYLRRYEEGQRYSDGRWISAEEDARRHRDIGSGWDVETEHYTIRTDHSIEAAVALGVKLERLYRLWSQLFVRYYASQADVVAMFDGRAKPSAAQRRHDVVYFRDRDEYVRSLEAEMPNIAITVGVYRDQPRRAYFFPGKHGDDRTLYHEATHQLFHESRPVAPERRPAGQLLDRRGDRHVHGIAAAGERLLRAGRIRRPAAERRPISLAARPLLRSARRFYGLRHGAVPK